MEIKEVLEEEDGPENVQVVVPLEEGNEEDFLDKLADRMVDKMEDRGIFDELINDQKIHNNNSNPDEEEEEERNKEEDYQYMQAKVRGIIVNSKKEYVTTPDLTTSSELDGKMSYRAQAIRFMKKMNQKEEDVTMFKMDDSNPNSPWILTLSKFEDNVKHRLKKKTSKKRRKTVL